MKPNFRQGPQTAQDRIGVFLARQSEPIAQDRICKELDLHRDQVSKKLSTMEKKGQARRVDKQGRSWLWIWTDKASDVEALLPPESESTLLPPESESTLLPPESESTLLPPVVMTSYSNSNTRERECEEGIELLPLNSEALIRASHEVATSELLNEVAAIVAGFKRLDPTGRSTNQKLYAEDEMGEHCTRCGTSLAVGQGGSVKKKNWSDTGYSYQCLDMDACDQAVHAIWDRVLWKEQEHFLSLPRIDAQKLSRVGRIASFVTDLAASTLPDVDHDLLRIFKYGFDESGVWGMAIFQHEIPDPEPRLTEPDNLEDDLERYWEGRPDWEERAQWEGYLDQQRARRKYFGLPKRSPYDTFPRDAPKETFREGCWDYGPYHPCYDE